MAEVDRINAATSEMIRQLGVTVAALGSFEAEMVCLEGVIAGLLASSAYRHNRQPDELTAALCNGVRERVTRLVYSRRQ